MAARQWTELQKARQRALIQNWQPWQQSTGAKTVEGKAISSQNSLKSGNYTAAALQEDREHRDLLKQHDKAFKELLRLMQEEFST